MTAFKPGDRVLIAAPPDHGSQGTARIAAERQRQITDEGYTPEHDAAHPRGELARAGAVYALRAVPQPPLVSPYDAMRYWPADWHFKAGDFDAGADPVRMLAKAGALIAAEIDRLLALDAVGGNPE